MVERAAEVMQAARRWPAAATSGRPGGSRQRRRDPGRGGTRIRRIRCARGDALMSEKAVVWFAPMRSVKKVSLVKRAGTLLDKAGLADAMGEDDLVAVKLHFGEEGNTGFVQPVFLREVVRASRRTAASRSSPTPTRSTGASAPTRSTTSPAPSTTGSATRRSTRPWSSPTGSTAARPSTSRSRASSTSRACGSARRPCTRMPWSPSRTSRATRPPASAARSRTSAWGWAAAAPSSACTPTSRPRSPPRSAPRAAAA